MEIGYIYKLTSPSNKIYIGQSINLEKRLSKYKNVYCEGQPKLCNSLKKYGFDNHTFLIIETIESNDIKSKLNEREIFWIEYYNSYNDGLNCNKGGKGNVGVIISNETRKKYSLNRKGKQKPNITSFKKGNLHPFFGKKRIHSEETKQKISLGNIGKKHTDESKRKIGEASKGRTHIVTDEIKEKIRQSKIGTIVSQETKDKISKYHKGKKTSEETKRKLRESNIGQKRSEETKRNISQSKKGKPWTEARILAQKNRKK